MLAGGGEGSSEGFSMNESLPYRPLPPIQTLFPVKCESITKKEVQLTDVQIANWRKVLLGTVGPIALILSKQDIQDYKDACQKTTNVNLSDLLK